MSTALRLRNPGIKEKLEFGARVSVTSLTPTNTPFNASAGKDVMPGRNNILPLSIQLNFQNLLFMAKLSRFLATVMTDEVPI